MLPLPRVDKNELDEVDEELEKTIKMGEPDMDSAG